MNFGLIPSPPDERDYVVRQIAPAVELPASVRLDYRFTIRNQGECPTCVGKAGAEMLSTYKQKKLSALYLYTKCKELDGMPDLPGTYPRVALKVLQKQGCCSDKLLPYIRCEQTPAITSEMDENAENFKIGSYARCYGLTDIKQALANNQLVMAAILVGDNFMSYKADVVGKPTGNTHGYHAVILCGYDDEKRAFRGVNSWGRWWGEDGYFWLDYDVLSDRMAFPEAWAMTTNILEVEPKMEKLKSRKFILAVVSAVLVILNEGLGWDIPTETVMQFVYLILGWIFVEGAIDFKHAK